MHRVTEREDAGDGKWVIRCDSCRNVIDLVLFQIMFSNGAMFQVCEACTPVPGETSYLVHPVNVNERTTQSDT